MYFSQAELLIFEYYHRYTYFIFFFFAFESITRTRVLKQRNLIVTVTILRRILHY